jgi:hypothetical protein
MKKLSVLIIVLIFVSHLNTNAQLKEVKFGQLEKVPREDPAMQKWRENRFGQFIHWGLASIPAGVWKGKSYLVTPESLRGPAKIQRSTWDSLMYQFNPLKFDAGEWAALAKNMGVKYVTFTTKHHDGFCLWPSKYTDYDMGSTPYKRDVLKDLVNAYSAAGIDVYLYYSIIDIHHPDWRTDLKNREDTIAFERLKEFSKNQLAELLDLYPQAKGFWFDGTWDSSWKKNGQFSFELEKFLKQKRPGLIVNARMRADEYGNRYEDANGKLMGDFNSGYERALPDPWDTKVTETDWEACMTIPENFWGYHKDWSLSHVKSPEELIEMLVHCVSQGGNFLLNFGPKSDGTFREEEVRISKRIGEWMKENSSVIYNCGYSYMLKQDWGYYTKPKNKDLVNMVVFNSPLSGKYKIVLPEGKVIKKGYYLNRPTEILKIEEVRKGVEYFVCPGPVKYSNPFVIVLELKNELVTSEKPMI